MRSHPSGVGPLQSTLCESGQHQRTGEVLRNTVQFANGKGHGAIRQLQTDFFTHFAQRPELIRLGKITALSIHGVITHPVH